MRKRDGHFVKFCTLTPFPLAELLWKRTTVSQEWIAEKLSMRSAANVSQQLRRFDRAKANAKLPMELQNLLKEAWDAQT